ncbi:hypothetical protein ACN23B_24580 [Anabaena sp. FACHB-709]|uniref:Uncharacterized protein n=1 Tax=Anabaena cylindrica FACHB-318 TaxID=2692880 RepID=A0ABR7ZKW3_ANACY|nr:MULTISPECIES: hypothetical protein [Nostocaceae]HBW32276.1 hypothetical protein [Nostoc sp. UBA8866]MBD2173219.1 hypothetical protein [Anabaena cylindrica FACHB-318]MBD2264970.1 hypothetical protein [Anabaena sp. FACHB-709]MBD2274280.1 hypothetical protein [Nostoc sp. PCC 7120 = FACHB-418]MBD2285251.1 hypothetical protein [Anabaena cylindrica FACHB-170]
MFSKDYLPYSRIIKNWGETQQNQGFFVLGYSTRRLRLRSSTQPTRKFINAFTIKDYEFLFNESNRRALGSI